MRPLISLLHKHACAVVLLATGICDCARSAEVALPQFPATEFGTKCREWFTAFNSGEYESMLRLHAATDGEAVAQRRALQDYRVYLLTRGVAPAFIEQTRDNSLTIAGQENLSGTWIKPVVVGSTKSPVAITEFGIRPGSAPANESAKPRLTEMDALRDFDEMLTRASDADEFSGTALVARRGKTIFKKAWGKSNRETGSLSRTDTKFNLASAGKMFTGVAILQLAQAGKLGLDDTVGKHLPDYPNKDVHDKVTIRQLLTHTSGLGEMFNARYQAERNTLRTVKAFVSLFENDPLRFPPGRRWSYSNAGYCLLGAIVESASGEDYYKYIGEHIFAPAGMRNTGAFETDKPVDNLAIGYTRDGARSAAELRDRHDNLQLHVVKGSPAGGSFSTVEDLLAFATAVLEHRLLNAEYTSLALTGHAPTGLGDDASGFGFQVEPVNGHRIIGHRGGFPGISASFFMYPDDGYVVAVLSNYDSVAPVAALRMRDWIVSAPVPDATE